MMDLKGKVYVGTKVGDIPSWWYDWNIYFETHVLTWEHDSKLGNILANLKPQTHSLTLFLNTTFPNAECNLTCISTIVSELRRFDKVDEQSASQIDGHFENDPVQLWYSSDLSQGEMLLYNLCHENCLFQSNFVQILEPSFAGEIKCQSKTFINFG